MKYIVEIDTEKFTKKITRPELVRRFEAYEVARLLIVVANMLEDKAYLSPTRLYDKEDDNKVVGEIRIVEVKKNVVAAERWLPERSSGFAGFRCQKCGTWVYAEKPKVCACPE